MLAVGERQLIYASHLVIDCIAGCQAFPSLCMSFVAVFHSPGRKYCCHPWWNYSAQLPDRLQTEGQYCWKKQSDCEFPQGSTDKLEAEVASITTVVLKMATF